MSYYDEEDNNVYDDELEGGVYDEDFDDEDFDLLIDPVDPSLAGVRTNDSIGYDENSNAYDEDGKFLGKIKKFGSYLSPTFPLQQAKKMLKAKSKKAKKVKRMRKAEVANSMLASQQKANVNKIPLVTGGKSSTMQAVFGVGKASKAIKMAVETKSVVVPLKGIEDINILTDNIMLQEQSYNQIVADIRIAVSGAAKKRTNKGAMPTPPGVLAIAVLNSKFFGLRVRQSNSWEEKKYDAVRYILSGTGCDPIEFIVIPKDGALVQEFVAFSVNLSQSVGRIVPSTDLTLTVADAIEDEQFYIEGYNAAHCPSIEIPQ